MAHSLMMRTPDKTFQKEEEESKQASQLSEQVVKRKR
jgi:hypothetical protein